MPGDRRSLGSVPAGSARPGHVKIHLLLPNVYFWHQSTAPFQTPLCFVLFFACMRVCDYVQGFVLGLSRVSSSVELELDTVFPLFTSWASH